MENPTQSISDHGWEQYFLDMKVTKKKNQEEGNLSFSSSSLASLI